MLPMSLYCHGNEHMSGLYFTVQPHLPVLSPVSNQTSACSSKCGVGRCKDVTTGDIPCKCTAGLPCIWGDRHLIHPFAIRPTNAWWFQYRWQFNRGKGPFDKVIEMSIYALGGNRYFSCSEDRGYLMSRPDHHREHIDGVYIDQYPTGD